MRILVWLVRLAVFVTLFAFAISNQHESVVHWGFGREWRAPTVFIVLAAFGAGCAFGIFAMVPSWWRHRRLARRDEARTAPPVTTAAAALPAAGDPVLVHPPRDGL